MAESASQWFWWIFMSSVAALSTWRLIGAIQTDRIALVRDVDFGRKSQSFEFWFLTSLYLIVIVGTIWMLSTGLSPLK